MTFLRFLLAGFSILIIFVSGGLFFQKKEQSYLMLSIFTFLFGLEMLAFLYGTSSLIDLYPYFYGRYYMFSGLLYGPLLLFHFNTILKNKPVSKSDLLHLLPLLIMSISLFDILILPHPERIEYINAHFLGRIMFYNYMRALHILCYGIFFIWMIRTHYQVLSSTKRLYAFSFTTIYFLTAVTVSFFTAFANGWRDFIYYYLLSSTIFLLIAFILYKKPEFLRSIQSKYLSSNLSKKDLDNIIEKLSSAFEKEEIYLDGRLSVRKLGKLIDENPHSISQAISLRLSTNFNSYVNRYRVDYAKKLFQDPAYDHYKIEGIALESGFNNKVTFNRSFKEFTGQTPSAYRSHLS